MAVSQRYQSAAGWIVYDSVDTPPAAAPALLYRSALNIDADGSPHAYHPPTDTAPHGHPPGLDDLRNAGSPGNWYGIATDASGNPVVQGADDPAPGFYVSTTSLADPAFPATSPKRYVDSETIHYIVLPGTSHVTAGTIKPGDFAAVYNEATGKLAYAIYADAGPADEIGEGSMALGTALGLTNVSPMNGGTGKRTLKTIVFPGSGNRRPRLQSDIDTQGAALLSAWGGLDRLKAEVLA